MAMCVPCQITADKYKYPVLKLNDRPVIKKECLNILHNISKCTYVRHSEKLRNKKNLTQW